MAAEGSKGKDLTLLLVGKTGNGKSSTGNTILRAQGGGAATPRAFSTAAGFSSNTVHVEEGRCQRDGRSVKVINTPDLHIVYKVDCLEKEEKKQEKEKKKASKEEVGQWIDHADGYPDAILLVIRADCRYTREEFQIYQQLKELLERKIREKRSTYNIQDNLVVAFTMGDCLNGRDLGKDLQDASQELKEVLKNACHRYVVFDNTAGHWEKEASVATLLEVVDTKKPHPFPQQVCRLLLDGDESMQQAIATMLCPRADSKDYSKFFYFSCEPCGQMSSADKDKESGDESDRFKLEVALTPARGDTETEQSLLRSVSPGPHAVLYVKPDDSNSPQTPFNKLQSLRNTYRKHLLLVVVDRESAVKQNPPQSTESEKTVVLPNTSRDGRLKLLREVKNLVSSNKGRYFQSDDLDGLADELQDKLSAKNRVSYRDYLSLKSQESKRHIDSRSVHKTSA